MVPHLLICHGGPCLDLVRCDGLNGSLPLQSYISCVVHRPTTALGPLQEFKYISHLYIGNQCHLGLMDSDVTTLNRVDTTTVAEAEGGLKWCLSTWSFVIHRSPIFAWI